MLLQPLWLVIICSVLCGVNRVLSDRVDSNFLTGQSRRKKARARSSRPWSIIRHQALSYSPPPPHPVGRGGGARACICACMCPLCYRDGWSESAVENRGALMEAQLSRVPATVSRQIWGWWVVFDVFVFQECTWLSATHSLLAEEKGGGGVDRDERERER